MTVKPLRLINPDNPSRAEIEMARIAQQHREYRSPNSDVSNPRGWQPIERTQGCVLDVDGILNQYLLINQPLPWWRRWLRRIG